MQKDKNEISRADDLPDNEHDAQRLQGDEAVLDLPDVKDIPGQEFIHVPPLGELADVTISSADEEGAGLFGDEENDASVTRGGDDLSRNEKQTLDRGADYQPTKDEDALRRAALDSTDAEGEPLNEGSFGDERLSAEEVAEGDDANEER